VAPIYELMWRYAGAKPTVKDDMALWALNRESISVKDERKPLALLGSSRLLAGFCPSAFEKQHPDYRVVQLAWTGRHPLAVLKHLSEDKNFVGYVIVEVTVASFFPENTGEQNILINYYNNNWSRVKKIERSWKLLLEDRFVLFSYETNPLRFAESILLHRKFPLIGQHTLRANRDLSVDYNLIDAKKVLESRLAGARSSTSMVQNVSLSTVLEEAAKAKIWVEAIKKTWRGSCIRAVAGSF
jgi:hypothetical protein